MTVILSRIVPKLGAHAYKSYSMQMPLDSHWRKATCAEYECDAYLHGFEITVDTSTDLGRRQLDYLTHDRTRKFTTKKVGTYLVKFTYGPGFEGFAGQDHDHRIRISRPPLMLVTGGDWRGNPRGTPAVVHQTAEDWADDFATHQDALKRAAERA